MTQNEIFRYNVSVDYFETLQESRKHLLLPANELLVALIRARGLQVLERNYFGLPAADPFAKLIVNDEVRQSKVAHRTVEPEWSEKYSIPAVDDKNAMLKLLIFDWNLGSVPDLVGQACIPLQQFCNREPHRRWFPLSLDETEYSARGEVELALRWIHNPNLSFFENASHSRDDDGFPGMKPNCLRAAAIRAKNLRATDFNGAENPSATFSLLLPNLKRPQTISSTNDVFTTKIGESRAPYRSSSLAVRVEKNTQEPSWHETFSLPCTMANEDETAGDSPVDYPTLYVELEDHTHVGIAGMLGAAKIDLETLLDRRRHRFWASLRVTFKTRNGKQLAQSCGRIELILQ